MVCSAPRKYKSKSDNTCYKNCPSGFIERNNYQCIEIENKVNGFTNKNANNYNKLYFFLVLKYGISHTIKPAPKSV